MAVAAAGNGFASFLLGGRHNGSAVEPAKTADQNLYYAFYAGDTYRLTRRITLNLGARVDLQGNWTERTDRIVALNATEASPLLALSPAVAAAFPNLKGGFDLVNSSRHGCRSAFPTLEPCQSATWGFVPIRPEYGHPDGLRNVLPARWMCAGTMRLTTCSSTRSARLG